MGSSLASPPAFAHEEQDHHAKHDSKTHAFYCPWRFNDERDHDYDSDDSKQIHPKLAPHGLSVHTRSQPGRESSPKIGFLGVLGIIFQSERYLEVTRSELN